MNENICAISTSMGVGAISIVRCSGPDVVEIVNKIFDQDLTKLKSHTINYGHILDNEKIIDEVLLSIMLAPKTYTKEDVIEINTHGGIATTNKVLELLIKNGCRLAERGEFIKKAFLNGRIDLVEAEGVNDLINSTTDLERSYAINKVEGRLSNLIKKQRDILVNLEATLEVNFDYPEEADNPIITNEGLKKELEKIKQDLDKLIIESENGQIIKNGINVGIFGKPNVGKSSILNRLLEENKAIVTDIEGTTRDIVEGSIILKGIKLNIIDTAGLRKSDDIIEQIGIKKSLEVLDKIDLMIYVLNNNKKVDKEDLDIININKDVKKIIFINKDDLESIIDIKTIKEDIVYGNTVDLDGLENLKNKIIELFNIDGIKEKDFNFLTNARQIGLVNKANDTIKHAIDSVDNDMPYEMIAVDIKEAFDLLGEIIGVTYQDELLDTLFSKFCLGK